MPQSDMSVLRFMFVFSHPFSVVKIKAGPLREVRDFILP